MLKPNVVEVSTIHYLCDMIVYNTTYSADRKVAARFVNWLRSHYVPAAVVSGQLVEPQLAHLMTSSEDGSHSFSLQFKCESVDVLEVWYHKYGAALVHDVETKFGTQVSGFSTVMTIMDLKGREEE